MELDLWFYLPATKAEEEINEAVVLTQFTKARDIEADVVVVEDHGKNLVYELKHFESFQYCFDVSAPCGLQ